MNHLQPNTTHGGSYRPEYISWKEMRRRCNNPKVKRWKDYGGRGIKVCDEWNDDFAAFFAYVGPKPSPKHSIDRYPNNDGNYEPGNVRWATPKQQVKNRRRPDRSKRYT